LFEVNDESREGKDTPGLAKPIYRIVNKIFGSPTSGLLPHNLKLISDEIEAKGINGVDNTVQILTNH
jgi:hypothetical protein